MDISRVNTKSLGFFRFKRLAGDYLLTNDAGEYCFLESRLFDSLLMQGPRQLEKNNPTKFTELSSRGFLRNRLDFDSSVRKYCSKNLFLGQAPYLHIVVVTLRCDHKCIYCQSKAGDSRTKELDMDIETAKKVVDLIFASPSPDITIEFQGGEPLLNFGTVKFIVEYARQKCRAEKRKLTISMVSNLNRANEKIVDFLIENDVDICTSLDGPQFIHNHNRVILDKERNSYKNTVKWIKKIRSKLEKKHFRHRPNALLTVS